MSAVAGPISDHLSQGAVQAPSESVWAHALRSRRVIVGGGVLLAVLVVCAITLPLTLPRAAPLFYDHQNSSRTLDKIETVTPKAWPPKAWFGFDTLGRSIFGRCLLGGTISLAVGVAAATISVLLGVTVGLIAGYHGGWVDSALMRTVDVLYGLPYILLVILFKVGIEPILISGGWLPLLSIAVLAGVILIGLLLVALRITRRIRLTFLRALVVVGITLFEIVVIWLIATRGVMDVPARTRSVIGLAPIEPIWANLIVLFSAIGLVSWLTMARVVRGQVLSLRSQPFIEACRAMGLPNWRVFIKHILPNLVGPITVYATLTVPQAILQESFLSFLGVGVNLPLPTWGNMAAEAIQSLSPVRIYWWMLLFPCILLVVTLLSLNFMGDGLRDVFDPKRESAKI
jgi:ABC-type dipeptide/oligopeptide/nickel transport system permease subunit